MLYIDDAGDDDHTNSTIMKPSLHVQLDEDPLEHILSQSHTSHETIAVSQDQVIVAENLLSLANKGTDNDDADSAIYIAREETESTSSHPVSKSLAAETSEATSSHQDSTVTKQSDAGVGETSKASKLEVSMKVQAVSIHFILLKAQNLNCPNQHLHS